MKINPEQINQVVRENKNVQTNRTNNEFGKMLENEIAKDHMAGQASSPSARLDLLQQSQILSSSLITSQQREPSLMNKMDSLLNMWENYAADMDSPDSNLKQVYNHLQNISQGIKDVKNSSSFENQRPEVKSILQELEVMTATEEIKINRGDYLT
ncbi:hypothetical protein [Desulfonatronovibrio magnus]|uniref:hypothetical protein n=1 Tax=Desulfonatronovibrio magnus TaxID=698827 RepID=UPI000698FB27|nr:hypothetical protein [Desulfonatronovibrio magnus]